MPIYTYRCSLCYSFEERIRSYALRDQPTICECGEVMKRAPVEQFISGPPAFKMGAVLGNNQIVHGHFGKEAKLNWSPGEKARGKKIPG